MHGEVAACSGSRVATVCMKDLEMEDEEGLTESYNDK